VGRPSLGEVGGTQNEKWIEGCLASEGGSLTTEVGVDGI